VVPVVPVVPIVESIAGQLNSDGTYRACRSCRTGFTISARSANTTIATIAPGLALCSCDDCVRIKGQLQFAIGAIVASLTGLAGRGTVGTIRTGVAS
jgi:hypothetical protein